MSYGGQTLAKWRATGYTQTEAEEKEDEEKEDWSSQKATDKMQKKMQR